MSSQQDALEDFDSIYRGIQTSYDENQIRLIVSLTTQYYKRMPTRDEVVAFFDEYLGLYPKTGSPYHFIQWLRKRVEDDPWEL